MPQKTRLTPIALSSWPDDGESLILDAFEAVLGAPVAKRTRTAKRHLVEYETYPVGVVGAFEAALAQDEAEDSPEGFARFSSIHFNNFLNLRVQWAVDLAAAGKAETTLVVPRDAFRTDPAPYILRVLGFLVPSLTSELGTGVREDDIDVLSHQVRDWLLDQPAPDVLAFRHYDDGLFRQLGQLALSRLSVQETFREVMGREPREESLLHLQSHPTLGNLAQKLKSSPEYLAKHPVAHGRPKTRGPSALAATGHDLGLERFVGVSWPRSGHHMLVRLLQLYFGKAFGYCQFYGTNETCCKTVPCARHDIHLSKNHDFDLTLPQRADRRYLIQYREFLPSAVSNFELHVRSGGEDSGESFLRFTSEDFGRYQGFVDRWVTSPFAQNQIILRYEDLLADPETAFAKVIAQIDPNHAIDRENIRRAIRSVDGEKVEAGNVRRLEKSGVHKPRDLHEFRYYDGDVFDLLARLQRSRPAAIRLARKAFGRQPTELQILRAQASVPGERLDRALVS